MAAIAESIASAPNLFKILQADNLAKALYEESPALGMIEKDTTFYGIGTMHVVVSIAPGSGGGASIATAIGNQGPTQEVKFSVGRKKLYEVGSIDGETIAAGRNSKGAVVDVLTHSTNRALEAYSRTLSRAIWNGGGGARGQITAGSNVATPTITLTSRVDAAAFFKGMWIQLAPDDGITASAGVRGAGTQIQISNIVRKTSAGTATITVAGGNWNQIAGATAGDFIFRSSDYQAYPNGIPGWAPTADPGGGDSFLTVNRNTAGDMNYLSGWRVAGNGQPKQQTLIDAGAEAHVNGLKGLKNVFVNPLDLRDAFKEQGTFKTIPVGTKEPTVGYEGIPLQTAVGSMTVLGETDVPLGSFWLIDPSTWTMISAGDVPMLLDYDGIRMFLRNPGGDDYQYRYGSYLNFKNEQPHKAVIGAF